MSDLHGVAIFVSLAGMAFAFLGCFVAVLEAAIAVLLTSNGMVLERGGTSARNSHTASISLHALSPATYLYCHLLHLIHYPFWTLELLFFIYVQYCS